MSAWVVLSPLLCVGFGGIALMLLDAFARDKSQLPAVTSLVLLLAGSLAGALWHQGLVGPAPGPIGPYLAVDGLAQFFHITICAGTLLSALLAGGYTREHALERGELYPILLFTAFGAMVLAAASDLLTIFIGIETMSLGVYCLVAFRQGSHRSAEAAIKYFLLGSFAAALLLFGSALLYGATGHTDLAGIGQGIRGGTAVLPLVLLGLVLVVGGLAFKVSAVPFHMWTPDAYEGAITPVTTFMSVAVKAAAFATLLRVLLVAFGDALSASAATGWPAALALLSAVTLIWGNFAAAQQASVKRMLAYSSIAHAGYLLIGVVAIHGAPEVAVSAVLYYLAAYTVSNVLAFGSLIAIGSYHREAVSYDDLLGVGRRHPAVALPMALGVLSLMGFPPHRGLLREVVRVQRSAERGGPVRVVGRARRPDQRRGGVLLPACDRGDVHARARGRRDRRGAHAFGVRRHRARARRVLRVEDGHHAFKLHRAGARCRGPLRLMGHVRRRGRSSIATLAVLALAASCDCGKPKPKPEPAKPTGPAVLTGHVLLAPGAELPEYTPDEMEQKVLDYAKRGPWPDVCTPPKTDDRRPVHRTEDGFLSNVMVAASDFSRPSTRPSKIQLLEIDDCRLKPKLLIALKGDLLRIQNEVSFPFMPMYTPSPSSSTLIPGQNKDYKLDKLGFQPVRCTFTAPCGRSDVMVLSHTIAAITDENGQFRIDDFPASETVTINAWHPLFQPATKSVRVEPGQTRDVEIVLSPRAAPPPEPTPKPAAPAPAKAPPQ